MDVRAREYRLLMADVYELAGISRSSSDQFAERYGQTAARWHVLSVVSEEALTVPRIADRLGLARQSVQRVVDDLRSDRLLELIENPVHRRSPLVAITEDGTVVAGDLFAESESLRTAAIAQAGLKSSDLAEARQVVRRLLDGLKVAVEHSGPQEDDAR